MKLLILHAMKEERPHVSPIPKTVISYTEIGVGKITSAVATWESIKHVKPDLVILAGCSGGVQPDLVPGDILFGIDSLEMDFNFKALGVEKLGDSPFSHTDKISWLENNLRLFKQCVPDVEPANFGASDTFIDHSYKESFQDDVQLSVLDAVDMESAAVSRVCRFCKAPLLIVRVISDTPFSEHRHEFNMEILKKELMPILDEAVQSVIDLL